MKKGLRVFSCVLALLLMLLPAGCGSAQQSSSGDAAANTAAASSSTATASADKSTEPVTITVWHVWGGGKNGEFMDKAIADFEKENPNIKIEATSFEPDQFQAQGLKTAVAANEFADVTHAWGGAMVQPFVEAGKVLPLDKYMTDDVKSQLMPGSLNAMTFDGKVYGLPYLIQPCIVIYNKALFDANGLQIPETYDDLVKAVQVFRSKGITPLCLGEKEQWTGMMYYDMMAVRALGANACTDILSGKTKFDSPEMLDVTKKFADLVSMKAFDPGVVALSRYEAEMEFKMGKIPMLLEGSWVLGDTIIPEDSAIKDTAVVKAFPTMSGSTGTSSTDVLGGANDTWIANASTKHPDEAFKVASSLIKSVSLDCYANNMGISAWKVPDGFDTSNVSPCFVQVKDIIEKSQSSMLYWDNVMNADLTQTHKNLVQDLYAQKISPEDFVKKMQEAIDATKK